MHQILSSESVSVGVGEHSSLLNLVENSAPRSRVSKENQLSSLGRQLRGEVGDVEPPGREVQFTLTVPVAELLAKIHLGLRICQPFRRCGGANSTTGVKLAKAKPPEDTHSYSLKEETAMMTAVKSDRGRLAMAIASYTGVDKGELEAVRWEDRVNGDFQIQRKIWCGKLKEPKTEKRKAPIPVIPHRANMPKPRPERRAVVRAVRHRHNPSPARPSDLSPTTSLGSQFPISKRLKKVHHVT
jgi:hypothetical protein